MCESTSNLGVFRFHADLWCVQVKCLCKQVVGTHALLSEPVHFAQLGVAVVDEQHRFGVAQRAKLQNKNTPAPHILAMTVRRH
jgi:RecG-like helicase